MKEIERNGSLSHNARSDPHYGIMHQGDGQTASPFTFARELGKVMMPNRKTSVSKLPGSNPSLGGMSPTGSSLSYSRR